MASRTPVFTAVCNTLAAVLLVAASWFGFARGDWPMALAFFAIAAPLPGMTYLSARGRKRNGPRDPKATEP